MLWVWVKRYEAWRGVIISRISKPRKKASLQRVSVIAEGEFRRGFLSAVVGEANCSGDDRKIHYLMRLATWWGANIAASSDHEDQGI